MPYNVPQHLKIWVVKIQGTFSFFRAGRGPFVPALDGIVIMAKIETLIKCMLWW